MKTVKIMKTIEIMRTVEIMKTKAFMAMAALALVAVACNNDDEITDDWNGVIRLSSGLEAQQTGTRATTDIQSTQFASGEKIDVFISEDVTTGTATTTYAQPLVYTAGGSGTMDPPTGNQPYFPTSGNGVNIYAYYPSNKVGTDITKTDVTFTVEADQSGNTNYKASDLMYGKPATNPVARTSSATILTFKHLLSKVTIKLVQGAGSPALTDAVVKLKSVYPSTTLNASTGTISGTSGNTTDITVKANTTPGLDNSAVVVPQTLATSFIEVKLANGGVLTSKDLKDGSNNTISSVVLVSGYEYTYTITVNLTSLDVTSTITPWTSNTANGTATMQ